MDTNAHEHGSTRNASGRLIHSLHSNPQVPDDLRERFPWHVGEICLNMKRADNGTRTRGLDLGKVALYQLSYVRDCSTSALRLEHRTL